MAEGLLILEVECSRVELGAKEDSRGPESYDEPAKADRRSRHVEYTFFVSKPFTETFAGTYLRQNSQYRLLSLSHSRF
jgi:hypothetical protein